jgi:dephospho-CoA kinase
MLIGLTGGIGSGKSSAAQFFAASGAKIVDADAIARALTASGGAAMPAIRAEFGDTYVDDTGALDRARMRNLIFSEPAAKERLENIVHPQVRADIEAAIARVDPQDIVVLDVPLLFEGMGYRRVVDTTVAIDCTLAIQVSRVLARGGHTQASALSVIAAQLLRPLRLQLADHVLCNSGTLEDLKANVAALLARLRA